MIGYDTTETLVYTRPELYVLVTKYAKYACPGNPGCGVASPERPTSLVEGDRYDTSVAAAVVEAKWFHHLPIYRHQDVPGEDTHPPRFAQGRHSRRGAEIYALEGPRC